MPIMQGGVRSRTQDHLEGESSDPQTARNSGLLLLSLTQDILFITPDASQILDRLLQCDSPTSSDVPLPSIIRDMCDDLAAAWYRSRTKRGWPTMQMRKVTPLLELKLQLGGYVIPERGYPPTCRLLIIFETLMHALPSDNVQATESLISLQPLLTTRQEAVARGLMRGLTNKELASELSLSTHTVKDYVRIIMAKLNVTTRSGLVARLIHGTQQEAPTKEKN